MKILIATDSSRTNDFFAVKFVTEGIEPIKAISNEEIMDKLKQKNPELLLLDVDSKRYNGFTTVKEVKAKFNQVVIMLLTTQTGLELAKKAMDLGVFGFVTKVDRLESQFTKLVNLLENLSTRRIEKRKYMRVTPDFDKKNVLKLKIEGLKSEHYGQVKDISLGGILATMEEDISDSLLFKGKAVNVKIELDLLQVSINAQVVKKNEHNVALLFRNTTESHKKKISEYIITRIGQ